MKVRQLFLVFDKSNWIYPFYFDNSMLFFFSREVWYSFFATYIIYTCMHIQNVQNTSTEDAENNSYETLIENGCNFRCFSVIVSSQRKYAANSYDACWKRNIHPWERMCNVTYFTYISSCFVCYLIYQSIFNSCCLFETLYKFYCKSN